MRDRAAALVSLEVWARPEQPPVLVRLVPPALAEARPAVRPVATAPVDHLAELRCAQLAHRADRSARARSACRSFPVSAQPALPLHSERMVAVSATQPAA